MKAGRLPKFSKSRDSEVSELVWVDKDSALESLSTPEFKEPLTKALDVFGEHMKTK